MRKDKPPEGAAAPSRVRDRIFTTARELFSRQGIRAVGVDAIAGRAGTNKMSFYRSFASKDALVAECVRAQETDYWRWWEQVTAPHAGEPRAQIEALFKAAVNESCDSVSAGCGLNNAAVELRDDAHPALAIIRAHKAEVRGRLRELAAGAGARDAAALGDALLLLLEGGAATRMTFADRSAPADSAVGVVKALLDAQLLPRAGKSREPR